MVRCRAITQKGTQCSREAKEASEYCFQHGPVAPAAGPAVMTKPAAALIAKPIAKPAASQLDLPEVPDIWKRPTEVWNDDVGRMVKSFGSMALKTKQMPLNAAFVEAVQLFNEHDTKRPAVASPAMTPWVLRMKVLTAKLLSEFTRQHATDSGNGINRPYVDFKKVSDNEHYNEKFRKYVEGMQSFVADYMASPQYLVPLLEKAPKAPTGRR